MKQYVDLLKDILDNGEEHRDRTGVGTKSVFGRQLRFDLKESYPLVTVKPVPFRWIAEELFFFLRGETNRKSLNDKGIDIWNEWGDRRGNLGPIYSHQWVNFGGKHANRPQPPRAGEWSIGSYKKGADPVQDRLMSTWRSMICRCYLEWNHNYEYYGGKGVFVADRWLDFDNFVEDAQTLEGWSEKLQNWAEYELDKDGMGDGFCYGPKTTSWVTKSQNSLSRRNMHYVIENTGTGQRLEGGSGAELMRLAGIRQGKYGNFNSMLRGTTKTAFGWRLVEKQDNNKGFNQIQWVMEEIARNPESRRLIVSAWNPADLEFMALPPCPTAFQFKVHSREEISCLLFQRSADVFLGLPFDVAEYALLTRLIAEASGLKARELVVSIGDAHLYNNHIQQAGEVIDREPFEQPVLNILDPGRRIKGQGFDGLLATTFEDLQLTGYRNHGKVEATVAV